MDEGSNKKRGNQRQLTQFDDVDETVGEGEEAGSFQVASQEELSKRRIVTSRRNKNKNTQTENAPQETGSEKPKFDFFTSAPTNTFEINNTTEAPKLDFNFETQKNPTFDFTFGDPNNAPNTTTGFDFGWKPTENPFGVGNNAFMETKSSFEANPNLFSNAFETTNNTFEKISSQNQNTVFQFGGNNTTTEKNEDDDDNGNGNDDVVEAGSPGTTFTPLVVVPLNEETVKTGEEDEEKLFAERSKLFVLQGEGESKTWKERGVGRLTINKAKDGTTRFVFRTDQTRMVRLNALVYKGMISKIISEKGVTFLVVDSESDSKTLQSFFVRFQTKELALKLLSVLQDIEKSFGGTPISTNNNNSNTNSNTNNDKKKPAVTNTNVTSTNTSVNTPLKKSVKVVQHAEATFVDGNVRGIVTFVQDSDKKKTLIEGSFRGVAPSQKFSLLVDSKPLTSFTSDSQGEIKFIANKVLNLIEPNSSLNSSVSVRQESNSLSYTSNIKADSL